jgi:DNA-binding response OmpR family regulator
MAEEIDVDELLARVRADLKRRQQTVGDGPTLGSPAETLPV